METSEWKVNLERARETKDAFFAQHWQSPIPPKIDLGSEVWSNTPPDQGYRFELELREHAEKQIVRMAYTKGSVQDFLRWGEFRFNIGGREQSLQAYRRSSQEDTLFVPFKDVTSGKETHGTGHYLDLETDGDRTPDGKWVLDLNQAYNPWCAYSEDYTCPLIPMENWLEVSIYAGEKDYHLREEH